MLDSDLFEVLVPVLYKADLFFALWVKLVHDMIQTLLEAALEDLVIVVASPYDCFVV